MYLLKLLRPIRKHMIGLCKKWRGKYVNVGWAKLLACPPVEFKMVGTLKALPTLRRFKIRALLPLSPP